MSPSGARPWVVWVIYFLDRWGFFRACPYPPFNLLELDTLGAMDKGVKARSVPEEGAVELFEDALQDGAP